MNPRTVRNPGRKAFTLVEMLIVISVIAVMAALVVSAFSNAAQDTRRVVARQQQTAVQNAVNAWVTAESSGTSSLAAALKLYNAESESLDKLILVGGYLDEKSYDHFVANTDDGNAVQSAALKKTDQYLELSDWVAGSYPKVELK
jgi:prepilin-type N-terminal cleavage/methylation domain-containing protein